MKVIQACWEDVSAALTEMVKANAQLRAKAGPRLDALRADWARGEASLRFNAEQTARRRVVLALPLLALLGWGGAKGLGLAAAAVAKGSPAWLAARLGGSPVPGWLLGPGRPWLLTAVVAVALAWFVRRWDRWRAAHRRLVVRDEDCPYPSADLGPKLWDELAHWPSGLEGLHETEGSEGERVLTTLLAQALDDRYLCLLGPLVAEALDVDLLILGPTGLWVLDSKFHRGRVEYVGGQFVKTKALGERTVEKEFDLVREMDREVEGVRAAVAEAGLRHLAPQVRGVVVFTHPEVELRTQGAPFPCLLPRQVPGAIQAAAPVRALNQTASVGIVDALARQAKRLATRDSDRIKASARDWVRQEAVYRAQEIADCIERLTQAVRPRGRGRGDRGAQAPGDGRDSKRRRRPR